MKGLATPLPLKEPSVVKDKVGRSQNEFWLSYNSRNVPITTSVTLISNKIQNGYILVPANQVHPDEMIVLKS